MSAQFQEAMNRIESVPFDAESNECSVQIGEAEESDLPGVMQWS